MTSIYDIPKKDIDLFLKENGIVIDRNDVDYYEVVYQMIKSGNYLPNSVTDNIVDWVIANNLNILKINVLTYNITDIYLLSDDELKYLASLLKLDKVNIESIINILKYLGKLEEKTDLSLKSIPVDVIIYMLKDVENPQNIIDFCLTNKSYKNDVCNNDNFWKEKYVMKFGNEGIIYLQNKLVKNFQELYNLNYYYHELNKKLKFYKDFGFWFNVEELFMRNRKLREFPEEIFLLTKLKILSLAQNKLTEIPRNISKLTNLHTLSLSRNKLISVPDEIGQLKNLEVLNLKHNKLISLPESLSKLDNLRALNISDNPNIYISEKLLDLPKLVYTPKILDRPRLYQDNDEPFVNKNPAFYAFYDLRFQDEIDEDEDIDLEEIDYDDDLYYDDLDYDDDLDYEGYDY